MTGPSLVSSYPVIALPPHSNPRTSLCEESRHSAEQLALFKSPMGRCHSPLTLAPSLFACCPPAQSSSRTGLVVDARSHCFETILLSSPCSAVREDGSNSTRRRALQVKNPRRCAEASRKERGWARRTRSEEPRARALDRLEALLGELRGATEKGVRTRSCRRPTSRKDEKRERGTVRTCRSSSSTKSGEMASRSGDSAMSGTKPVTDAEVGRWAAEERRRPARRSVCDARCWRMKRSNWATRCGRARSTASASAS